MELLSPEIFAILFQTNMLQWMEITVSEPEKRSTTAMKMQDTFVVYLVETRYGKCSKISNNYQQV